MDRSLYQLVANPPNYLIGNRPQVDKYFSPDYPELKLDQVLDYKEDPTTKSVTGKVRVQDDPRVKRSPTGKVEIAFTARGDQGPVILFLHGVPTNRRQYYPIMERLSSFARCIAIDMLGMGDSQVNRDWVVKNNSKKGENWRFRTWLWEYDVEYIHRLVRALYGPTQFVMVADDWGGGVLFHYAARYPKDLLNQIYIDPVALDGYPVNEIQAIGRAAVLPDSEFKKAMGSFDQTAIQIYKTMVYQPSQVWNQYTYRWIMEPYVNVNYVQEYSSTMGLKWNNLRNLSDRAYVLGGPQLLPYHPEKNPLGVKFRQYQSNALFLWGAEDNMMPEAQRHRLRYLIRVATQNRVRVDTRQIPQAGHFAGLDQPELIPAEIMDYLLAEHPYQRFGDIFLGFEETRIWKGDENQIREELRNHLEVI